MNKIFSFEKSIGAVVFRREGEKVKYLLLLYPGGHWGFIKGHIETNETDEETLLREAQEETGIMDLRIKAGFLGREKYFYVAKNEEKEKRLKAGRGWMIFKKVLYYLAETNQAEIILSHEHRDYIWMEYNQAHNRVSNLNSKKVLEKVNRFLVENKIPLLPPGEDVM
ncbi:MAG: NUDIX domain-containing protein [Candidatus Moranbacteria bacterium]|nr:NUDIX domain-containing protein [Candidatus Moranbacteria bacterium]